jgi:phosphomannomutase
MSKNKVTLKTGVSPAEILIHVKEVYRDHPLNDADGLRIDFDRGWVHLRQSNTEPIMRIYAEGVTPEQAESYAGQMIRDISQWTC